MNGRGDVKLPPPLPNLKTKNLNIFSLPGPGWHCAIWPTHQTKYFVVLYFYLPIKHTKHEAWSELCGTRKKNMFRQKCLFYLTTVETCIKLDDNVKPLERRKTTISLCFQTWVIFMTHCSVHKQFLLMHLLVSPCILIFWGRHMKGPKTFVILYYIIW